ncbi:hypothetical protein ACQPXB_05030 [Amycolatopsis sp. CA-161197]|uniref:hypothetical protein n=1 Tax=Amycolatopsis sp. CA-161197 TaxID=3239922 RepID=UPI003D8F5237
MARKIAHLKEGCVRFWHRENVWLVFSRRRKPMRQSWKISGSYANWRMIVCIEPPDDANVADVPAWPFDKLAPVVGHFFEAVNYYEMSRDADDTRQLS